MKEMSMTEFANVEHEKIRRFMEYMEKHHPDVASSKENEVFWLTQYITYLDHIDEHDD